MGERLPRGRANLVALRVHDNVDWGIYARRYGVVAVKNLANRRHARLQDHGIWKYRLSTCSLSTQSLQVLCDRMLPWQAGSHTMRSGSTTAAVTMKLARQASTSFGIRDKMMNKCTTTEYGLHSCTQRCALTMEHLALCMGICPPTIAPLRQAEIILAFS